MNYKPLNDLVKNSKSIKSVIGSSNTAHLEIDRTKLSLDDAKDFSNCREYRHTQVKKMKRGEKNRVDTNTHTNNVNKK